MPKTITGSVGRGGKNYPPSDVMTVQYLLNCVPAMQGGPAKELAVDGAAGPKTIAAIESFQRKLGGFADGRVDPGGATFRALQAADRYPNQPIPQSVVKSYPPGGGQSPNKLGAPGQPVNKGSWNDPGAKAGSQGGWGGQQSGQPPVNKGGWDDPGGKMGGGKMF